MSKKEESDEAPDIDSGDQNLFRRAVSDIEPLQHDARATQPRRVVPKARFSRADEREILRESMESDYDDRDMHSANNLRFHRASVGKRTLRKLARGSFAVQDELDLHGMTVAEAQVALQNFISDACIRGFTCVRIVHGKGLGSGERGPVLKRKVASLLRRWQQVLAFVSARQVDGGTGAVYVLLEKDA
jgi:DNA-nicking Smr family endonuclease